MATRQTRLVIKNNTVPSAPFSGATLLKGEAIVNTADGILMFSGVTSSSSNWTPAGVGGNANFFEVGSNLYDLKIRNKITHYNNTDVLTGQFLSGTTNGFALANIVDINYFNGLTLGSLTVNGVTSLSGSSYYYQTVNGSNPNEIVNVDYLTAFTQINDVYVTGATYTSANDNTNNTSFLLDYHSVPLGGPYTLSGEDTYTTGGTYDNNTTLITFRRNDGNDYTVDLSTIDVNDTFVTAYTYTASANTLTIFQTDGEAPISASITSMSGLTINGNLTVTGNTHLGPTTATTIDAGIIYSGGTDLYSLVTGWDVYVTGFTYNPNNNTFTIERNRGEVDLTTQISSVTGLTISTLDSNRVVYTTNSGQLTTEAGFEYNASANTLTVGNINVQNPSGTTANIGQGGLVIGSGGSLSSTGIGNLTVHGDLTVFGTETIVATTELYIEDPQITLNYNPTGSTVSTSISSGIRIQDGNGVTSGDTYLTIGQMQNLVSGDTSEYTGLNGYNNRGWVTQLNDIVIRNTNKNDGAPDGVRVLAEGDILDGGQY